MILIQVKWLSLNSVWTFRASILLFPHLPQVICGHKCFYFCSLETCSVSGRLAPPQHTFLQSSNMSHEAKRLAAAHFISPSLWLDDSSCQSLSSAFVPPPPSSSLYGDPALTPPTTCCLSSSVRWNGYYGNLYPSSSGDWMLPGGQSWGRGHVPGAISTCVSELCVSQVVSWFYVFVQSSVSVWAAARAAPPCGGETPQEVTCVTAAASRRAATHLCWDPRGERWDTHTHTHTHTTQLPSLPPVFVLS